MIGPAPNEVPVVRLIEPAEALPQLLADYYSACVAEEMAFDITDLNGVIAAFKRTDDARVALLRCIIEIGGALGLSAEQSGVFVP